MVLSAPGQIFSRELMTLSEERIETVLGTLVTLSPAPQEARISRRRRIRYRQIFCRRRQSRLCPANHFLWQHVDAGRGVAA